MNLSNDRNTPELVAYLPDRVQIGKLEAVLQSSVRENVSLCLLCCLF